ncbi:MAG: hypothetical protein ACFCBV_01900 [Phycisphaerales bacterium]
MPATRLAGAALAVALPAITLAKDCDPIEIFAPKVVRDAGLWPVGVAVADFDGDGALTLFDFLAFQNAFDAGC